MSKMEAEETEVERAIKDLTTKGIKYVRLQFTDTYGVMRCRTVPTKYFKDRALNGIQAPLITLSMTPQGDVTEEETGYDVETNLGDASFFPIFNTLNCFPWVKNTAGVLTSPVWEGVPVSGYPRNIALRQLEELKQMGYILFSAHEYEFTVIERKTNNPIMDDFSWGSCQRMLEADDFLDKLLEALPQIGIDVDTIQSEHGPGQLEITYMPTSGIAAADKAAMFKNAVKEVAWKHGLSASFMSRPDSKWSTCSGHFNHSLLDAATMKPVMFDPSARYKLSSVAEYWLAGLLAHASATAICMAPTINCISRFHSDAIVPSTVNWGIDNRMALMRAKTLGEGRTYFESRMGSSASDPYISLAATVAAGMDGIKKKMKLPDPVDCIQIFMEGENMEKLPKSLDEAITCFREDDVICKAFGEQFTKCFLALKRFEKQKMEAAAADGQDEFQWARDAFFKYL